MTAYIKKSDFLTSRFIFDENSRYHDRLDILKNLLSEHLIQPDSKEAQSKIFSLIFFLNELIHSAENKSSMIAVLPFPNIANYAGVLTPFILSSIGMLMKEFKKIDLSLPMPQLEIETSNVTTLQEILTSDLFSTYSKSQAIIEHENVAEKSVLTNTLMSARNLQKRYSNVLDLREMAITLLPISTKFVDDFCGGLPAKIGSFFGDTLTNVLKEKKKIVIYDYGSAHYDLLVRHYGALHANKTNSEKPG